MDRTQITDVARALANARKSGKIAGLAHTVADFPEAVLIQEEILGLLGEKVAAFKVSGGNPGDSIWGPVVASHFYQGPATVSEKDFPARAVEGEIAFRLDRDVLGGETIFTRDTFDRIVTPVPVIEIVETRFLDPAAVPANDKLADFSSNGGLVVGKPFENWKGRDLAAVPVTLSADGEVLVSRVGGHAFKDPRIPAIAFLNSRNRRPFLPRGTVITTGAVTGLARVKPGATVKVAFEGLGEVEASFA